MPTVRLVPIDVDGKPSERALILPAVAEGVCVTTAALYKKVGFQPPWTGYLAVSDMAVVGTCAFTSAPRAGKVEIAYFTFPGFEARGIATEMARSLIGIARAALPTIAITANTLPEENASTAVLRKLGFELHGTVDHPEDGKIWEWRLPIPGNDPNG